MIGSAIISKFETYVDDGTELSATEELDLLNKKYREVCAMIPWEFLKKPYSNTISGTTKTLPTDFGYICSEIMSDSQPIKVVYVGDNYYQVVNFSDRMDYTGRSGYCWINIVTGIIEFSESVSGTLEYDYIYIPADITLSTSPIFPTIFHDCLYHLMAADDYMIQQFDKAKSYAVENQKKADQILDNMRIWNANLQV